MKKIFFAVCAIAFFSSLCFSGEVIAAPAGADQGAEAAAPAPAETVTGIIDAISVGGGMKPQMTVRGENREETAFSIAPDVIILGRDGSATSLNWVKGNKVLIEYVSSPNGARTAKSIKVLSDME